MSYAVHMNVTGARRGTSLQAFKSFIFERGGTGDDISETDE